MQDESYLCSERRSEFFPECYFEIFRLLVWIRLIFRRLVNEIFSFGTNPGNEFEEAFRRILIGRKYFCKSAQRNVVLGRRTRRTD